MVRDILLIIFRIIFRIAARVDVQGMENYPREGGVIIAANHLALADAPFVYITLYRKDLTALVGDTHKKNPFFRFLANSVGGIWLNREEVDLTALRAAIDHLRKGGALGVAPEGTRSKTGAIMPPKTGVAYLADKAGVPILPVAITGTENAFHNLPRLKVTPVTMRIGKPFTLPPISRSERDTALQRNTDEIMCRIAALLPEKYQGVYAGNPRIRELAQN